MTALFRSNVTTNDLCSAWAFSRASLLLIAPSLLALSTRSYPHVLCSTSSQLPLSEIVLDSVALPSFSSCRHFQMPTTSINLSSSYKSRSVNLTFCCRKKSFWASLYILVFGAEAWLVDVVKHPWSGLLLLSINFSSVFINFCGLASSKIVLYMYRMESTADVLTPSTSLVKNPFGGYRRDMNQILNKFR